MKAIWPPEQSAGQLKSRPLATDATAMIVLVGVQEHNCWAVMAHEQLSMPSHVHVQCVPKVARVFDGGADAKPKQRKLRLRTQIPAEIDSQVMICKHSKRNTAWNPSVGLRP